MAAAHPVPIQRGRPAHLTYREHRRAAQYAALDATASPIDDDQDAETVLADLRQARKDRAAPAGTDWLTGCGDVHRAAGHLRALAQPAT
jgi:hypothetical protein